MLQADEAYVLPVLLRFDGHPEVDELVSTFIASFPYIMFFMSNLHSSSQLVPKVGIGRFWKRYFFVLIQKCSDCIMLPVAASMLLHFDMVSTFRVVTYDIPSLMTYHVTER